MAIRGDLLAVAVGTAVIISYIGVQYADPELNLFSFVYLPLAHSLGMASVISYITEGKVHTVVLRIQGKNKPKRFDDYHL